MSDHPNHPSDRGYPGYPPPGPPVPPRAGGMAITALVLALVSIPALVLCGLGLPLALVALVLGIIAAARGGGRGMAVGAIVVSLVVLAGGTALAVWIGTSVSGCADTSRYPTQESQRDCVRRNLPFVVLPFDVASSRG